MLDSSEAHDQASLKSAKDRDGELYPAFASEKSRNEASGKTVAHRHVPLIQTVQKNSGGATCAIHRQSGG